MSEKPERTDRKAAVRSLLLEEWGDFADQVGAYQWPREGERWREFAFCTLYWAGQPHLEAASARQLVQGLEEFGMLDVEALAAQVGANGEPDVAGTDFTVMQQLLQRQGLAPERAQAAVATLCQAALALRQQYGGKVQRCLRQFGQHMLDVLQKQLALTYIQREDSRQIIAHWLQNVLSMPIPLCDAAMLRVCSELDVDPEEVVAVADELDINVALVDDMFGAAADQVTESEEVQEET